MEHDCWPIRFIRDYQVQRDKNRNQAPSQSLDLWSCWCYGKPTMSEWLPSQPMTFLWVKSLLRHMDQSIEQKDTEDDGVKKKKKTEGMKGTLISIYWVVWKFQQKTSQVFNTPSGLETTSVTIFLRPLSMLRSWPQFFCVVTYIMP